MATKITVGWTDKEELEDFIAQVSPDNITIKETIKTPLLGLWKNENLVAIIAKADIKRKELGKLIRQVYPGFNHIDDFSLIYGEYYILIMR